MRPVQNVQPKAPYEVTVDLNGNALGNSEGSDIAAQPIPNQSQTPTPVGQSDTPTPPEVVTGEYVSGVTGVSDFSINEGTRIVGGPARSSFVAQNKLSNSDEPLTFKGSNGTYVAEPNPIGAGGMGVIFKALRIADNNGAPVSGEEAIAIKLVLPHLVQNTEQLDRFEKEIEHLSFLGRHGGKDNFILPYVDSGVMQTNEGDAKFLATKYVTGGTLESELRSGTMSLRRALLVIADLGDALAFINKRDNGSMVHRDLKPDNLLLEKFDPNREGFHTNSNAPVRDKLWLGDFGLVDSSSSQSMNISIPDRDLTQTNTVMGTVGYMSPEQCFGAKNLTHASDLFSMGTIVRSAILGGSPYERSGNVLPTLQAIQKCEELVIPTVAETLHGIPVDNQLDVALESITKVDPRVRTEVIENTADLADTIRTFVRNNPSLAYTASANPASKEASKQTIRYSNLLGVN